MAREGFIHVPGGAVCYRSVGAGGIPLLCLHGGPGFTSCYLEALEDLAEPGGDLLWPAGLWAFPAAHGRDALDR
jgi:pimeloyl-ACP methyl ester carboxylesterase